MPVLTKKPTSNPAAPRRLEDCPAWQQGLTMKARLEDEERAILEKQRNTASVIEPSDQERRITAMATRLLTGSTSDASAVPTEDATSLAEQRKAVQEAIQQHTVQMRRLHIDLSAELYRTAWAEEHLAARKRIVQGIIALKEAFDVEQQVAGEMRTAGLANELIGLGYRLLFNTSCCPQILTVFRNLRLPDFRRCNQNLL